MTIGTQTKQRTIELYIIEKGGPPLLGRDFIDKFNVKFGVVNKIEGEYTLENILKKNMEIFNDEPGKFSAIKVQLHVREDSVPIYCRPRSLPFKMIDQVEKEIDRLEKSGFITPVDRSEWGTPLVPVAKPDGSIRLCGDYKITLNKFLIPHRYPVPTIHDIFRKLRNGQQFTRIDLKEAYTQLELDDESSKLCAWSTTKGAYLVNRMPYGILPATSIFQENVEKLFADLKDVVVFVDDIAITGKDKKTHLKKLEIVLQRLRTQGIRVKKEKCLFLKDEIQLLGHIISAAGIKKIPAKVEKILKIENPSNTKEVKSLMGILNFYSKFIPNMATIMNPIYALTRKNVDFIWTEECSLAVIKIKKNYYKRTLSWRIFCRIAVLSWKQMHRTKELLELCFKSKMA